MQRSLRERMYCNTYADSGVTQLRDHLDSRYGDDFRTILKNILVNPLAVMRPSDFKQIFTTGGKTKSFEGVKIIIQDKPVHHCQTT